MVSRFAAFVIWAAVAASLVFWAARLWASPTPVPPHATLVSTASASRGDLARLFGSAAVATVAVPGAPVVATDARFQLVGVVAPRSPGASAEGLAVITFDGKPARAYRVGTPVDGELVLLSVHARGAALGPWGEPAQVTLELPLLPPPQTGTLSGLDAAGGFGMPGQEAVVPGAALPPLPLPPALAPRPLQSPMPGRGPQSRGQKPL
ncbi:MAG: type II secretion system protein N [Rubrivivax sp.]